MALRTNRNTNHDMFRTVAIAVTALVLFSCQKESLESVDIDSNMITVYPVINRSIETTIQTRAQVEGSDFSYSEFTTDLQSFSANAIAFSRTNENSPWVHIADSDQVGIFAPVSSGWRSTVKCKPNYRYNLYAYSRTLPSQNNPVFNFTSESDVTLTFTGLDILTTTDPLVCIASAGAIMPTDSLPELTQKEFNIGVIPSVVPKGKSFKAFLAFDHLYSKATLSFRIDNTYSQLRKVHIKDVQIKVDNGTVSGTHVYSFYTQDLTLGDNHATGNAASIDLFDGPTAKATPAQEGDDFIELTTSPKEFGYYYFLPLNPTPSMYLEVTYDILSLNGDTVRENQTARNSNLFASINYSGGRATAGKNYNVNILVSPTYLYQLSDDDLELGLTIE